MPRVCDLKRPLQMRSSFALVAIACTAGCHAAPLKTSDPPPRATREAERLEQVAPYARDGSALVVGRIGSRRVAFVADEDEDAIHTLDLDARREIARTDLAGRPARLVILRSGRIAVTLRDAASVAVLELESATLPLRPVAVVATADEPIALSEGADDDKLLWVASGWGRSLEAVDLGTGRVRTTIALGREPRALTLSEDGTYAFVGSMSDSALIVVNLGTEQTGAIDLRVKHRRFGRQLFAFARLRVDGVERVFAPYTMVEPGGSEFVSKGYGAHRSNR